MFPIWYVLFIAHMQQLIVKNKDFQFLGLKTEKKC